jgi:hypothetical protein
MNTKKAAPAERGQLNGRFQADVARSLVGLRVREEAQRRLRTGNWIEPRRMNLTGAPPPKPEQLGVGGWLQRPGLTWLSGEPETGKSLLVYEASIPELRAGGSVILLDAEAGDADIRQKLAALGARPKELAHFAAYDGAVNLLDNPAWLLDQVRGLKARLVIFDSSAPILAASGLDDDLGHDVVQFYAVVLQPLLRQPQCGVVVLDHKTKADPTSRYARGSGTKLQVSDVGYTATAPEPFARGRSGRLRLTCEKDRSGYIGRGTRFDIHVLVEDERIELSGARLTADQAKQEITVKPASEADEETLTILVKSRSPLTTDQVAAGLKVKSNTAYVRLTRLAKKGRVRSVPGERVGQATKWEVVV